MEVQRRGASAENRTSDTFTDSLRINGNDSATNVGRTSQAAK